MTSNHDRIAGLEPVEDLNVLERKLTQYNLSRGYDIASLFVLSVLYGIYEPPRTLPDNCFQGNGKRMWNIGDLKTQCSRHTGQETTILIWDDGLNDNGARFRVKKGIDHADR